MTCLCCYGWMVEYVWNSLYLCHLERWRFMLSFISWPHCFPRIMHHRCVLCNKMNVNLHCSWSVFQQIRLKGLILYTRQESNPDRFLHCPHFCKITAACSRSLAKQVQLNIYNKFIHAVSHCMHLWCVILLKSGLRGYKSGRNDMCDMPHSCHVGLIVQSLYLLSFPVRLGLHVAIFYTTFCRWISAANDYVVFCTVFTLQFFSLISADDLEGEN